MRVPMCRVQCVGELSEWGRTFVAELEQARLIDASFHESGATFIVEPLDPNVLPVVFVENLEETRGTIELLRASGRKMYLIWMGLQFTKEDLQFAQHHRVYCVFEGLSSADPTVLDALQRLVHGVELGQQHDQVLHSLKTLVLQVEGEDTLKPVIQELKAACKRLEASSGQNELLGVPDLNAAGQETKSPFYQAFDLSDALLTISNLERTGTLWVKEAGGKQEGRIEFLQGRVIAAVAGEVRGIKAIHRSYLWDEPTFQFTRRESKDSVVEEHLNVTMTSLCSEGEAHRTRLSSIRKAIPPFDVRLELDPSALHPQLKLSADEFATLASVVEFGNVKLIVDHNPLPDITLYESLIGLRRQQLIRVART